MTRPLAALALASLCACASLRGADPAVSERRTLWTDAHAAYAAGEYARADSLFSRLSAEYPETPEGVESLFFKGLIYLDPGNPGWDPKPAEAALDAYLASTGAEYAVHHHQWPEAGVLRQLARQLNMPPEQRVEGLQPETRTETRVVRVVQASENRQLRAEIDRLKKLVAERDQEIERIRKTLGGKGR